MLKDVSRIIFKYSKIFLDFCSDFLYNISIMENFMNIDIAYLIILVGSVYGAYTFGRRTGIGDTLDYMKAQGHIDFDE